MLVGILSMNSLLGDDILIDIILFLNFALCIDRKKDELSNTKLYVLYTIHVSF